jgi:lipoate-protein ligase A
LIIGDHLENSKAIISRIKDPYFNLALENYYLENISSKARILLLWENTPCVVIGRFQNPWIECNLNSMFENNVDFVRRQSGGGTVYHDSGNINFSFIADKTIHDKAWNHGVIVEGLLDVGVRSHATKRGDIRLTESDSRKISGSAFKEKKSTAFHHGTMLINSDLDKLNNFIHSNKQNLESKSISSVRSVVANITAQNKKLKNEDVYCAFMKTFLENFKINESIVVDIDSQITNIIFDSEYYKKLKSHSWRYEETPKFYVCEEFNKWNIELIIKKAKFLSLSIEHIDIHPSFLDSLEKNIIGTSVFNIVENIESLEYFENYNKELVELMDWFSKYFCLEFLL